MTNSKFEKTSGLHLYVTIDNYDDLLLKEEKDTKNIKKSLKLLNSFFVSIRKYASRPNMFPGLFIEKTTGNRMHIYIEHEENVDKNKCMSELINIALYAYNSINCLNNEVGKLASLDNAVIKIGADYGRFWKFDIKDVQNGIDEDTSVGYAANYACKLQALVSKNSVAISEDDYSYVDEKYRKCFVVENDCKLSKYHPDKSDKYYKATLNSLRLVSEQDGRYSFNEEEVKDIANRIDLGEMKLITEFRKLNINELTEKEAKKFNGISLMADIRGFTKKFKDDDSNLDQMAFDAYNAVLQMISKVKDAGGTHIQVQGDKEVAVFSIDYEPNDGLVLKDVIYAALHIIDDLNTLQLNVGIGMAVGDIYAARIDTKAKQDPVILGKTIFEANRLEDEEANQNELVISSKLYGLLKNFKESNFLCKYFSYRNGCYFTNKGYKTIIYEERAREQEQDTKSKNYTGAYLKTN